MKTEKRPPETEIKLEIQCTKIKLQITTMRLVKKRLSSINITMGFI